jgi:hypothetical protein
MKNNFCHLFTFYYVPLNYNLVQIPNTSKIPQSAVLCGPVKILEVQEASKKTPDSFCKTHREEH